MISRGLLISLGVTTLSAALLFVYFKNKINDVENKVQIIFDLVQSHSQNQMNQGYQNDIDVQFSSPESQQQSENVEKPNLISVSEDESDRENKEESDTESDEESDTESEEDSDIENDNVNENNANLTTNKKNDSLDENELIDKTLEISNIIDNEISEAELSLTNDNVLKLNTKAEEDTENDSLDDMSDIDDEEASVEKTEKEAQDLKKLTVPILKNLAEKKGLSNYKSLKKAALIKLIEEN